MHEDWRPRHTALLEALAASGELPEAWHSAFAAVPRHHFIPGDIWEQRTTCVPVTTDAAWWDLVYRDVPIVTQVDDGQSDGPGIATSSNSMPTMVARMLAALEVADGQCVLEIGTGSGWNAALLAARLGSQNVTTVEVDPVLAEKAAKAIKEAGYSPDVVWGDGAQGWESGAPYDRIIATCSVRRIPHAWVRQTTPGGLILAPLAGTSGPGRWYGSTWPVTGSPPAGSSAAPGSCRCARSAPARTSRWTAEPGGAAPPASFPSTP
ncbi:hypothetical protein SSPO_066790 [Streptomyces antimycoticus]|uniref:Protein-L-isoaspartate O-methyltransferase n=1 Tax=Streptomyces antimycoticus TaxID=68175 RepID=A0A499V330_9ACTN|nr:methyltransferase domain-containing protein [Streptomyces antimycoticus]BBJ43961.1 hypothetical protein SSPO_066790 [Streptomyces antimycoticus]